MHHLVISIGTPSSSDIVCRPKPIFEKFDLCDKREIINDPSPYQFILGIIFLVIGIYIIKLLIRGIILCFKKNPTVATLLLLFGFGFLMIWALYEIYKSNKIQDYRN